MLAPSLVAKAHAEAAEPTKFARIKRPLVVAGCGTLLITGDAVDESRPSWTNARTR